MKSACLAAFSEEPVGMGTLVASPLARSFTLALAGSLASSPSIVVE